MLRSLPKKSLLIPLIVALFFFEAPFDERLWGSIHNVLASWGIGSSAFTFLDRFHPLVFSGIAVIGILLTLFYVCRDLPARKLGRRAILKLLRRFEDQSIKVGKRISQFTIDARKLDALFDSKHISSTVGGYFISNPVKKETSETTNHGDITIDSTATDVKDCYQTEVGEDDIRGIFTFLTDIAEQMEFLLPELAQQAGTLDEFVYTNARIDEYLDKHKNYLDTKSQRMVQQHAAIVRGVFLLLATQHNPFMKFLFEIMSPSSMNLKAGVDDSLRRIRAGTHSIRDNIDKRIRRSEISDEVAG